MENQKKEAGTPEKQEQKKEAGKNVRATALETIRGSFGAFDKGDVFEIPENIFKSWSEAGIAEKAKE